MMDKIARKVLSRWLWQRATGDYRPEIPVETLEWSDLRLARYEYNLDDLDLEELKVDPLGDAKLSFEIMFPKVLATLRKKFNDKFYINSTSRRGRVYYYFSANPAMETITFTVEVRSGNVLLGVGYVPHSAVKGPDYSKSIHKTVRVRDPELTGLEVMRQLRSLLSKVP